MPEIAGSSGVERGPCHERVMGATAAVVVDENDDLKSCELMPFGELDGAEVLPSGGAEAPPREGSALGGASNAPCGDGSPTR